MWCKRETFQWAFKAKAGKRGFQPQSKPPVHTGGFDFRNPPKYIRIKTLVFWFNNSDRTLADFNAHLQKNKREQ